MAEKENQEQPENKGTDEKKAEQSETKTTATPNDVAKFQEQKQSQEQPTQPADNSDNFAKLREQIKAQNDLINSLKADSIATKRQLFAKENGVPAELLTGDDPEGWDNVQKIYSENLEKAKAEAIGKEYKPGGADNTSGASAEGFANLVKNNWGRK